MRAALLVALVVSPRLAAAEPGENALSLGAGGSVARYEVLGAEGDVLGKWAPGGSLALTYERGLTASLWARALVGGSGHLRDDYDRVGAHAMLGLVYRWDILQWVPQVALEAGGQWDGDPQTDGAWIPVVGASVAFDRLSSRGRSWGLEGSYKEVPAEDAREFTLALRTTWRWGYF